MLKKILRFWDLILLFVLSFFTRFWHLSYPGKVVFDEAHFGLYATKYLSHQYYFDIHPPLGKILLALFGFLGGLKPGFGFEADSSYGNLNFLYLRFLPALLGSLLIVLVYFFVKEIGFSRKVAFFASFLLLFDNALIVQSRFILLDVVLLFFIFLSFYLFVLTKRFSFPSFKWYLLNILTALSLGAAISIKWTGFGILGILWFLSIFEDKIFSSLKKENLIKIGLIFFLPLLIYFLIFTLHFNLLSTSCTKDCGYVLNENLENPKLNYFNTPPAGNLISRFFEVNKLMLASNLSSTLSFYYQSYWYGWPFMIRPIKYFEEVGADKNSYIYFFGNPFVWWLGVAGILGYLYLIIKNYFLKFKLRLPKSFYSPGCRFLILGFIFYLIPFAAIERFMLMYHYLPALVFSVILLSVFLEGILEMLFGFEKEDKLFFSNKKANFIFFGILFLVFVGFLFFSPLTYGFPLTQGAFWQRMWFNIWSF